MPPPHRRRMGGGHIYGIGMGVPAGHGRGLRRSAAQRRAPRKRAAGIGSLRLHAYRRSIVGMWSMSTDAGPQAATLVPTGTWNRAPRLTGVHPPTIAAPARPRGGTFPFAPPLRMLRSGRLPPGLAARSGRRARAGPTQCWTQRATVQARAQRGSSPRGPTAFGGARVPLKRDDRRRRASTTGAERPPGRHNDMDRRDNNAARRTGRRQSLCACGVRAGRRDESRRGRVVHSVARLTGDAGPLPGRDDEQTLISPRYGDDCPSGTIFPSQEEDPPKMNIEGTSNEPSVLVGSAKRRWETSVLQLGDRKSSGMNPFRQIRKIISRGSGAPGTRGVAPTCLHILSYLTFRRRIGPPRVPSKEGS